MPRLQFVLYFAGLSLLIAFIHAIIVRYSLEYYVWWIDLIPHTLGGAWLVFLVYFFNRFFSREKFQFGSFAFKAFSFFFAIAVLWEIFEVIIGAAMMSHPHYWPDTALDIIFDSLGAVITFGYLRSFHR